MKYIILIYIIYFCSTQISAQNKFPNTIEYEDGIKSPSATINSLSWLHGYWAGEAFGGKTEEIWSPISSGSIMCVFRLINNDKVSFYEIVTITEENGSLLLRLRHFNNNLTGWEEKNNPLEFRLVKVDVNRIYFDGFTFEKITDKEMNIYVIIKQKDGTKEEVKFSYKKIL